MMMGLVMTVTMRGLCCSKAGLFWPLVCEPLEARMSRRNRSNWQLNRKFKKKKSWNLTHLTHHKDVHSLHKEQNKSPIALKLSGAVIAALLVFHPSLGSSFSPCRLLAKIWIHLNKCY